MVDPFIVLGAPTESAWSERHLQSALAHRLSHVIERSLVTFVNLTHIVSRSVGPLLSSHLGKKLSR